MDAEPVEWAKDEKGRFVTGNIGGGRGKGSRNKLGEAFIDALKDDFDQHGILAIQQARAESPIQYVRVIASLLPRDVNLNVTNADDLTDGEIAQRIADLAAQLAPFLAVGTGNADQGAGNAESPAIASRVH
jgi:hypothetical protein